MSDQNRDYAAIQRNIEAGIARQKKTYRMIFFGMHLTFYVVTMLAVWGTVAANAQLRDALFNGAAGAGIIVILPTILWAFVILCHTALLFTESEVSEKVMRERLLMRELGEEMLRQGLTAEGMAEKPKRRAQALHELLSDDGELIPADADDDLEQREYAARSNQAGSL
jgi:hypothetical protein